MNCLSIMPLQTADQPSYDRLWEAQNIYFPVTYMGTLKTFAFSYRVSHAIVSKKELESTCLYSTSVIRKNAELIFSHL